jgi:hypothetical protein
MNNRIKRPPTVWITQALLLVFALLLLWVFLFNLAVLLSHLGEAVSLVRAAIGYSAMLGIWLLFAIAFWGLAKRKPFGRWLGLLSIMLLWGFIILGQLRRPSGPYSYYGYNNTAQLVGATIVQILLDVAFLSLILRLAFAKRVGKFFRREIEPA